MTVFDFEKGEQGDWFSFFSSHIDQETAKIVYDTPEEGAAEFRVRSMIPYWEEKRKGRKLESKMVLNPTTRAMERVTWDADLTSEQNAQESAEAWDYAITGFKNAFSAPGKPIECTLDNKLRFTKMPVFVRFIGRVFQIIADAGVGQQKAAEKNSQTPQDG